MPVKSADLHGNAPDRSPVVLLLIDVINVFDFPEARQLLSQALPAARRLAALKLRARRAGIPAVYVNDNFGRWRSDFQATLSEALRPDCAGRPISMLLRPEPDDYFVLKAKHSGFYASTLELLLRHLGARTLILTGFAGDNCVIFTAHDAYMRDFRLVVPSDCVASNRRADNAQALAQMRRRMDADTRVSRKIRLGALKSAKAA